MTDDGLADDGLADDDLTDDDPTEDGAAGLAQNLVRHIRQLYTQ